MKAYIIKSAKNNRDLEDLVNKAMEDGYIPQGGVQNDGSWFHQAMVKAHVKGAANILRENVEEIVLTDANKAITEN